MLTWGVLRYALSRRMVDVPVARSSHQRPTPRGGGASIVVVTSVVLAWLGWIDGTAGLPVEVLVGGLIVASIGFVDDHAPVAPIVRLASHFVAAAIAVWGLGGAPELVVFETPVAFGWFGDVLAVLFVVWTLNLTNFMDGIDGIAATQVLSVCCVGALLYRFELPGDARWVESVVLAAATAGFLLWNWPPAKIFMGDVGSGYLGFMLAVLTIRAAWAAPVLGWCWLVLSGVFISDATTTLVRRALRRAPVSQAHRGHAYQHLAVTWRSHRRVTLLVLGIDLLLLSPICWLMASGRISSELGLALAYGPLVAGALLLGAGRQSPG